MLRNRDGLSLSDLDATFAALGKILDRWVETENLDDLKVALGVMKARGRGVRRTQRQVNREYAIVEAMCAAAYCGLNLRTYGKATKALEELRERCADGKAANTLPPGWEAFFDSVTANFDWSYDAKQIARAWQEWGEFRIRSMSVMARHCESRGYEFRYIVDAIARLPPLDNK
jgi:hypothetical protein